MRWQGKGGGRGAATAQTASSCSTWLEAVFSPQLGSREKWQQWETLPKPRMDKAAPLPTPAMRHHSLPVLRLKMGCFLSIACKKLPTTDLMWQPLDSSGDKEQIALLTWAFKGTQSKGHFKMPQPLLHQLKWHQSIITQYLWMKSTRETKSSSSWKQHYTSYPKGEMDVCSQKA